MLLGGTVKSAIGTCTSAASRPPDDPPTGPAGAAGRSEEEGAGEPAGDRAAIGTLRRGRANAAF